MPPDPHEQAVEAMALAHCSGREHDPADCPALAAYRRLARKQLEAALPYLQVEQERPDPEEEHILTTPGIAEGLEQALEELPNPPSRAGEVAEELRAMATVAGKEWSVVKAMRLRSLAADLNLTEQEPSRVEKASRAATARVDAISEKERDG